MEPVKPLIKSDKTIQTPAQISSLKYLFGEAERTDILSIPEFSANVAFTPTQEWIDSFSRLGLYFYPDDSVPHASFHILHKNRPRIGDEPVPKKDPWELKTCEPECEDGTPWVPQNGEKIQCCTDDPRASELTWTDCWYIGKDRSEHVVRLKEYSEYIGVPMIRPYQKRQIPLDELLSVYASVKGLPQDGVELKPE